MQEQGSSQPEWFPKRELFSKCNWASDGVAGRSGRPERAETQRGVVSVDKVVMFARGGQILGDRYRQSIPAVLTTSKRKTAHMS